MRDIDARLSWATADSQGWIAAGIAAAEDRSRGEWIIEQIKRWVTIPAPLRLLPLCRDGVFGVAVGLYGDKPGGTFGWITICFVPAPEAVQAWACGDAAGEEEA